MSGPTAELGRRDGTENILRSLLLYGKDAGLDVWGKL
jgi:hypothetical protein